MFAGEVAWTATLEVGEICYAATVIKARIVIDEAWRSVVPRYAVCGRLRQVHKRSRLVELQRHQQIEMQNVNTETNMTSTSSKHVIDDRKNIHNRPIIILIILGDRQTSMINQSIKTHLYSAMCRKRIRGARRHQGRGRVVPNSSVFNVRTKVLKSLQDLQLNETEFQTAGALTLAWSTTLTKCAVQ